MIKDQFGNTRFYGLYRGQVVDNLDPANKRRLKVLVPQILGSQTTNWAWEQEAGLQAVIPAIGQGVWVQFEGGDPSFPVWTGTFGPMSSSNAIDGGSA